LACALAHQAARSGFSVLYVRAARLFDELQVAHGDGSFARRLAQLARLDLLVIDDFAISPIGAAERNDLLELLDDRIGARSTLITSQLPIKAWHTYLNDPTLADAILDRVVHSSHKIDLKATKSLRDAGDTAGHFRLIVDDWATFTTGLACLPRPSTITLKQRPRSD
jgi:DNA replication protein DnaC